MKQIDAASLSMCPLWPLHDLKLHIEATKLSSTFYSSKAYLKFRSG